MKKVLILGGNGFIDINLAIMLANSEYNIYIYDRVKINQFIPSEIKQIIQFIQGDFNDLIKLNEILLDEFA